MGTENTENPMENRTLKNLQPNIAALLCYVAGWVSGIIFLVLEQQSFFIRFHALQSIFVFGFLTLAGMILGSIPVVGGGFQWLIFFISFILWIVLIIKALNGEVFKMPWVGDLAERLANETLLQSSSQSKRSEASSISPQPVESIIPVNTVNPVNHFKTRSSRNSSFSAWYYSASARVGRIAGSAFIIAWSIVLIIFFNFYNQYIAYYEPAYSEGITHWHIYTLITTVFNDWLPVVTVTLVLTIIGHILLIIYDKYFLRQLVEIILSGFAVATVVTLLSLFPFNFSPLPSVAIANWVSIGLTILLIVMSAGYTIGAIVKFIQLIVNVVEGKY